MKKIFTKLMLLAVAAAALVSCENKFDEQTPVVELTQTVTLSAEKPTEVRTELIEGVPYWSKGDQIGVYVQDSEGYKNYAFKNDSEEASKTTSFTGTTAVANTLFVYYPYTNFSTPVTEKGVKVEILANQEPTAASFDGRTDLMIAKPVTLNEEGQQLENLEFARVAAIVKIVLKDNTGNLAGQHVSSLTMTAETNLVGRVYLDVVNQVIFTGEGGGLYYGGAKSVNATYTEATQYEVDGENATYVVVYPQTLATGSKLSFEAVTEGYAISKEITLPSDIELLAGKVTTLNVSLAAENVVAEATGLALPVEDDFSWITSDNESGTIDSALNGDLYSSGSKVYPLNSANTGKGVKLGSGTAAGSITTVDLNLSQPFSVVFDAKKFGSDASKLQVTAGDQVLATATLVDAWTTYVLEFEAVDAKEQITIEVISAKRAYLDNLKVVAGHDYVLPPVLTVNVESITSISHEGEDVTFNYSVANPVEGVSATVTAYAEWLTIDDNNGSVTVTVAENTLEEERNATITVKYGDLTKTIAIQQNAKPGEGGEQTAQYVKVTTAQSDWSGTYLIVSGTSAATTMNGSWLNYQTVTVSNDIIASNATTDAIAVTIAKSGSNYTIKLSDGKYLSTTNNNSGLSGSATADTNSTWTFSIESGAAKIVWSGNSSRHLRLNGTSGFRTYTNTTGTIATLYKLTGGNGGGSTPEPEPETPVLSVDPTTLSFDAAAGSKTIECTIENEVSGVNVTATETVDWLSTSVSGKTVTITATANTGAARNATVTIAYTGAESKTVTVSQAAGNTGGTGGDSGKTSYVLITNINDLTSGEYIMAAYANNKYIALPTNPTVSSGKIVGHEITVTNNEISETDADGYVWTFTKSGNYYTVSDGAKNLYHSKGGTDGTNLEYGTSSSYVWSITYDKAFVFAGVTNNNTVNGRGMLYQIGTVNKFGGYSLSNKSSTSYSQIYLFKKSN